MYMKSLKILKKHSGIMFSNLELPNSEFMNQYGIKSKFNFIQADKSRLTKLAEWVD